MSNAYLRFWGVRGSYAAPFKSHLKVGGNTSCVELWVDNHLLVCDGGTGIIPFGEQLVEAKTKQDMMIIFTHYHWDHICGMPFFAPAFLPDWNIKFFGPGESKEDIGKRLADQMKAPYFPVETETWMANIEYLAPQPAGFEHGPIQINYYNVHHPGVTYGYKMQVNGKSIVYVSDNEFGYLEGSIERRYHEFNADEHEVIEQMKVEERATELRHIKDVDILVHDAQYTPEDYEKKRGWGHSCYVDTVNAAIDANVKKLYLYHHDPSSTDEKIQTIFEHSKNIIREHGSDLQCEIASEGLVVDL